MHDEEQRDFDACADEWITREARFRAEIQRLERLIGSRDENAGGNAKESVALVRSQSLVHRDTLQSDRYLVRLQSLLNKTRNTAPIGESDSQSSIPYRGWCEPR